MALYACGIVDGGGFHCVARGSGMKVRCKLGCHAQDYPDIVFTRHGDKYDANKDRAPHTLFELSSTCFPRTDCDNDTTEIIAFHRKTVKYTGYTNISQGQPNTGSGVEQRDKVRVLAKRTLGMSWCSLSASSLELNSLTLSLWVLVASLPTLSAN